MRRLSMVLVMCLAALCAVTPAAQAISRAGLRSHLGKLERRMGASAGAQVIDLTTGQTIYARRADLPLAPASNEKLFVTATALLRFGPTDTLRTTVRASPGAAIDDRGWLAGNLYLVGGGDPTLSDAGLRDLVTQLHDAGLRHITGAVVGDESLFDRLRGGPDSGYRYDYDLGGGLSALSWNHGRMASGSPARAAAKRLGALLKARHITYGRRPHAGRLSGAGAAAPAQPLATLPSPAMRALVAGTNLPSENFYAEMLTKALGARFAGSGSTAAGLKVVAQELAKFGIKPRLVDGSGLSRADLTTPSQIVELLRQMNLQEIGPSFKASLPVAGVSGTLRKRMRGTAAAGRCRGKTGSLIGVSALSGYCTTTGGVQVAFSLLENRVCSPCAKRIEDRMVAAIARLSD